VRFDSRLLLPKPGLESEMDSRTQRIRALNDELRQDFGCGVAVMTPGIAALGQQAVARIV
jgi:hypothetical protein